MNLRVESFCCPFFEDCNYKHDLGIIYLNFLKTFHEILYKFTNK